MFHLTFVIPPNNGTKVWPNHALRWTYWVLQSSLDLRQAQLKCTIAEFFWRFPSCENSSVLEDL